MSQIYCTRLLFGLVSVAIAGCATGPQGQVPIEDRRDHNAPRVTLSRPATAPSTEPRREPIENVQPKVFALPDIQVEAPSATAPRPVSPLELEHSPDRPSNLAVTELVVKADAAIASGDRGGARAILERALKLRSDDAQIWYRLAVLNFDEKEFEQAIVAADRSRSLAGDDRDLVARATELMARAQSAVKR